MFGIPNPWVLLGGGVAAVALITGVFFFGQGVGEDKVTIEWQKAENAQLEQDLADQKRINAQLMQFNDEIQILTSRVDSAVSNQQRVVREVRVVNQPVIEEVFRETPFLSQGWVYAHDAISKGEPVDPVLAADRTPSNFTEADSLRVIQNNYATALSSENQVKGWIDFYDGVLDSNERLRADNDQDDSSSTPTTAGSSRSEGGTETSGAD